jgi:hypothetical protein
MTQEIPNQPFLSGLSTYPSVIISAFWGLVLLICAMTQPSSVPPIILPVTGLNLLSLANETTQDGAKSEIGKLTIQTMKAVTGTCLDLGS